MGPNRGGDRVLREDRDIVRAVALGDELIHALGHAWHGEKRERPAQVSGRVALLQAASEHHGETRAGYDAELTLLRNSPGEFPVGNTH